MHMMYARKCTYNALNMNTIPYMLSIELPTLHLIISLLFKHFFFCRFNLISDLQSIQKRKSALFFGLTMYYIITITFLVLLLHPLLLRNKSFPCSAFTRSFFIKQVFYFFFKKKKHTEEEVYA